MRDRSVRADDQVEARHDSRCVEKRIRSLIQLRAQVEHLIAESSLADLFGSGALLQRDQADAIDLRHRSELREWHGSAARPHQLLDSQIALPPDSNTQS